MPRARALLSTKVVLTKMMTFAKKSAYLTPLAKPSTISRCPADADASVTVSHLTYLFPMIADDAAGPSSLVFTLLSSFSHSQ